LVLNKWYICNKQSKSFQMLEIPIHSYVLWASLTCLYTCRNAKYSFIQTSIMLKPLHWMNEGHTNRSVKIERCEWVLSENRLCPKCQAGRLIDFHTHIQCCTYMCLWKDPSFLSRKESLFKCPLDERIHCITFVWVWKTTLFLRWVRRINQRWLLL
jgi:hypothetical protein